VEFRLNNLDHVGAIITVSLAFARYKTVHRLAPPVLLQITSPTLFISVSDSRLITEVVHSPYDTVYARL